MQQRTWDELQMAYRAPGRYYHGIDHVTDCLRELEEALREGVRVEDEEALRWAIWFHDFVYLPTRRDNEEESAERARQAALRDGYSPGFAARVQRLVMATKHGSVAPQGNDERLIVDIDLAALAADDFAAQTGKVRQEYAHVSDEAFYPARKSILRTFLERPQIYCTEYFQRKYESKARRNLEAAVT